MEANLKKYEAKGREKQMKLKVDQLLTEISELEKEIANSPLTPFKIAASILQNTRSSMGNAWDAHEFIQRFSQALLIGRLKSFKL